MKRLCVALACAALAGLGLGTQTANAAVPPVRHVFILILENENADSTFGASSKAPYLSKTLTARGQFLPNFYAVTHLSLGNYIALVSGQGSNPYTQADAPAYVDFVPGSPGPDGQAIGQGSVYPMSVKTIADQLIDKGLGWKGYMEDMGNTPGQKATCRHPALNAQDQTQSPRPGDQYATRHNPFVYFHSIIDSSLCDQNDVPLDRLPGDLGAAERTAEYNFITPNLCHDGHDEPCAFNGEPGGLTSADRFLQLWVPRITASPAYREGGVLIITFDEAEAMGSGADSSACCDQPQFPNTPNNGGPTPGRGGGRIGAVILSPYVRPGSVNRTDYNQFSLLRSVEDIFGLDHLGYAAQSGLRPFGSDVWNAGSPDFGSLALKPRTLRAASRGSTVSRRHAVGTSVSYEVSQPALVTFRVQRASRGRRVGSRCLRPRRGPRRYRRCTRWTRVAGSFTDRALAGTNSFKFSGRIGGRRLRPGLYRLVAAARGWDGVSGEARRRFRIVRR